MAELSSSCLSNAVYAALDSSTCTFNMVGRAQAPSGSLSVGSGRLLDNHVPVALQQPLDQQCHGPMLRRWSVLLCHVKE